MKKAGYFSSYRFVFAVILALIVNIQASPSYADTKLQKTDTSLMLQIEKQITNKNYNEKRGFNMLSIFNIFDLFKSDKDVDDVEIKEPLLPPRKRRFDIAKKSLNKLIYKNSIPSTIWGGVIGAAATVHPAGVLLGGAAGTLQGKSKRYEEAQSKLYQMEKDIFASQDHEVTDEEIRLSLYTGSDLSEFIELTPAVEPAPSSSTKTPLISMKKPSSPPPNLSLCYERSKNSKEDTNIANRRRLASQCFYLMN